MLPTLFPLLRPNSAVFEDWLADLPRGAELTRELVNDALAVLGDRERKRIAALHARAFPSLWASLVADVDDEHVAEQTVVVGAVVAALKEDPRPDDQALDLLDDDDPAEALALCIDPCNLWSIFEAAMAEQAVAAIPEHLDDDAYARRWDEVLGREADALATKWHRRRLALLVRRLRAQLPIGGFPHASEVLTRACAEFERHKRVRTRLATLLLEDTLDPFRLLDLPLAA